MTDAGQGAGAAELMEDIGLGPLAPVSEHITIGGRELTIKPAWWRWRRWRGRWGR